MHYSDGFAAHTYRPKFFSALLFGAFIINLLPYSHEPAFTLLNGILFDVFSNTRSFFHFNIPFSFNFPTNSGFSVVVLSLLKYLTQLVLCILG